MAKTKATHLERATVLFRMITYHLNSTCNMILNQTDEESELLGTTHIKNCLEHQHQMGSFEAILDGLDTLAIKIYINIPTDILESQNEAALYDYIQEQFRNSYR